MPEDVLLNHYLLVGAILFAIGLVGFLSRRNMIVMFLSAEMMLQAVAVNLVAFGRFHNDWGGQVLTIFVIAVAACEAAIALALVMVLFRRSGSLDITFWQQIREPGVQPFVDQAVPESVITPTVWPNLTPAGIEPPQPEKFQPDNESPAEKTREHTHV
jgi:NADH-quinone oxidoreductase subunit K